MSDALTDISRDEQRAKNFSKYLSALKSYLTDSSRKNFTKVIEAAKSTDAVRSGYWGGQTSISVNIKERLKKLRNGNNTEWARTLSWLMSCLIKDDWRHFWELKKLSPFSDKLLFMVDYGRGFMDVHAEPNAPFKLSNWVVNWIIASKNMKIYDADDYLVALDKKINPYELRDLADSDNRKKHDQILQIIDVIWLSCGIIGINGPRPAK